MLHMSSQINSRRYLLSTHVCVRWHSQPSCLSCARSPTASSRRKRKTRGLHRDIRSGELRKQEAIDERRGNSKPWTDFPYATLYISGIRTTLPFPACSLCYRHTSRRQGYPQSLAKMLKIWSMVRHPKLSAAPRRTAEPPK